MKPEMKAIELELTRTIPAFLIEVFNGWLDPKYPGTPWSEAAEPALDLKVDGLYHWLFIDEVPLRALHHPRSSIEGPIHVDIAPYTWYRIIGDSDLQKRGEDTLLTLRHENLPDDEYGQGYEKGWVTSWADLRIDLCSIATSRDMPSSFPRV